MGAKIGKNGKPVGSLADWLIGSVNPQRTQNGKNCKMVNPVGLSIYGEIGKCGSRNNGKTSRIIGRRTNWRYNPAWALKMVKMVNQ